MASDVLDVRVRRGGTNSTSVASAVTADEDIHNAGGEDEDITTAHQPLAGIVLCCTAIPPESRSELVEAARPLGAAHALDLTAAVTHLLVGNWDTAKYAYVAKARPDIRVLAPEFIDAARSQWISGNDHVAVADLESTYTYPALRGARICVTGFGDAEERKSIETRVRAAGGEYTGDLTREVTHLVAAKPEGAKYAAARQWKIRVVVLQWLEESLERGMLLEAARYDPLLPQEEIGRGAWARPSTADPVQDNHNAKRKSEEWQGSRPLRKLRRIASAKFSSQNENIWGEIVHGGVTKEQKSDAWEEQGAPEAPAISHRLPTAMPQRAASTGSLTSKENASHRFDKGSISAGGMFTGVTVYLHGFTERENAVLERHLHTHNASVSTSPSSFAKAHAAASLGDSTVAPDFLVLVPHTHFPPIIPEALASVKPQSTIATEFYIEACLHARRRLSPSASPLYAPLPSNISGLPKLTICVTGFTDIELLHLVKAIKRFGAEYSGTLRKDTSVLLCRPTHGDDGKDMTVAECTKAERELVGREKVRFAQHHGIPVLWAGWLWACTNAGKWVNWDQWELNSKMPPHNESHTATNAVFNASRRSLGNGSVLTTKGSADESSMSNITNGHNIHRSSDTTGNPPDATKSNGNAKDSPLAAALGTLLAARARSTSFRQGSHSTSTDRSANTSFATKLEVGNIAGGTTTGGNRRRRTLLGRAPSTASLRSVGSVGSANTDGVGTPFSVEGASVDGTGVKPKDLMERIVDRLGGGDVDEEEADPEPPLTQVAYQDVPAQKWRQKMDKRMAGAEGAKGGWEGENGDDRDESHAIGANEDSTAGQGRRSQIRDEVVRHGLDLGKEVGEGRRVLRRRA